MSMANLSLTSFSAIVMSLAFLIPMASAKDATPGKPPESTSSGKIAKRLTVAVVQMRSTKNMAENVSRIDMFIERAAKAGARVVVFPECAVTGYFSDAATQASEADLRQAEKHIAATCKTCRVYAVVGSPWREKDKLFNSALVLSPEGRLIERYDKVQLAESWPDPGEHLSVYPIDGVKCSTIICHDERYPELVRLPVLAGAQVIFYISCESGIREETKIDPYRAQIQARAVENGVWVIQSNAPANPDASGSHGQSRIIAPDGNIMKEASTFHEDILLSDLDIRKAGRGNCVRSLRSKVLGDWWREGLKRVRIIE